MRVGFDDQIVLAQARGGISRYFVKLIQQFAADRTLGVDPVQGWARSVNQHAHEAGLSVGPRISGPKTIQVGACYMDNWRTRRTARSADVLHHTYYHPRFRARTVAGLRVTTVHDMTPELYPELFPAHNPHLAKRRYVDESDLVICVSESTRKDLIAVYAPDPAKLVVIPLGVDDLFRPGLDRLADLPRRYILYVGSRASYKDFDVLLDALADCEERSIDLVAAGGSSFSDDEWATIRRRSLGERVHLRYVSDTLLPSLYANAELVACPSRHEGFGLPTLEAMASGTPVVLADESSHPEVGGDAAAYFRAGDPASLTGVLDRLLGDRAERDRLSKRGLDRAQTFTWHATAVRTANAYAEFQSGLVRG